MKIKISADSTCDLSQELIEAYGIDILPLYIIKNGESFIDGKNITADDIYAHVAAGGEITTTAAVGVADYADYFSKTLESYDAIIHFHISGEMSACYQNACIAAAELSNVFPVDSRNLSTGIGLLVLDAAELAREGKLTAEEIVAAVQAKREKLDVSFLVDTLAYLRKGGRCSAVAALGANLLGLKPCIEVKDGKMGVGKKYRGKMDKCLQQYVKERLEGRTDIDLKRIFITESGGYSDAQIEEIKAEILQYQPFAEVLHTRAGCTISSHCGPGTLGILYAHK